MMGKSCNCKDRTRRSTGAGTYVAEHPVIQWMEQLASGDKDRGQHVEESSASSKWGMFLSSSTRMEAEQLTQYIMKNIMEKWSENDGGKAFALAYGMELTLRRQQKSSITNGARITGAELEAPEHRDA
ncbi:unnamed protein product [Amoebophrya sp. A25]|nr:unnamed protein product [Amoebophrya sp. A25]|eukprot:GSA25T00009872001.1